MENNSPILNVDHINVLNEINGILKFDQVAIEQRGCEIIGLHLVDFMIVGRDTYHSWREASLVNELKK